MSTGFGTVFHLGCHVQLPTAHAQGPMSPMLPTQTSPLFPLFPKKRQRSSAEKEGSTGPLWTEGLHPAHSAVGDVA
jgi:hypothetical protein